MLMKNRRTVWLAVIPCLLAATPAWAQPVEWVVDADGLWEEPANWSSNPSLPGAGDDVRIDRPGFDLLITHSAGNVSIRSLTSEESLALFGGSFTVSSGPSVVRGDLVIASNRALVATGNTTSLTVLGAVGIDGANLFATAGATLDLAAATSYSHTNGNFQGRTLRADGTSSVLDLSGATVVNGAFGIGAALFIQAWNGGLVDLRSVSEIPVGGAILSAIGPDSTIDLTALTSLLRTSSHTDGKLEARGGGTLITPNLVTVRRVDIILDGVSQLTTNAIEIYTDGTVTLSGVAADFSRATNITGTNFNLAGGATVDLRNASVINRTGFNVADGVTLALPATTAYAHNGGNFDNRTLVARGAASVLDLSTLTTVSGGGAIGSGLHIRAEGGGRVDLRNTIDITSGATALLANGVDSVIDLSALTTYLHTNGNAASTVAAQNGGTILLNRLTTVSRVGLTLGSGGTIVLGPVQKYTNGSITVNGIPADFTAMTDLRGTTFTLTGGGTVDLSNASLVNGASFIVNDGVTLALPAAPPDYAHAGGNFVTRTFRAQGAGSVLDLSGFRIVADSGAIGSRFDIQALDGGLVDLRSVESTPSGGNSDGVRVLSDGADSVVDLSALLITSHGSFPNRSRIEARNGGLVRIHATEATEFQRTDLVLTPTGTIEGAAARLTNAGRLHGEGTLGMDVSNVAGAVVPGFGGITIDGAYEQQSGGALVMDIAGVDAGAFDVLTVTGTATLAGVLRVTSVPNPPASEGDAFALVRAGRVEGRFDALQLPAPPNGLDWHVRYEPDAVVLRTVSAIAPNLRIVDATAPNAGTALLPLPVRWSVVNEGSVPTAEAWQDCVYLSDDDQPGDDILLGCFDRPNDLPVGEQYDVMHDVVLADVPAGDYWVVFMTDDGDRVFEEDQLDNAAVVGSVTVSILEAPVIAAIADDTASEGDAYVGPTPTLTQGSLPVLWTLAIGPAGMTIDAATGVVSWPRALAAVEPHVIVIAAENPAGSAVATWRLTVPIGYAATVAVDLDIAPAGTAVPLQGQATFLASGDPAPSVPVRIRIEVKGTRRVLDAATDDAGRFTAVFEPLATEAGLYTVAAHHPITPPCRTRPRRTPSPSSACRSPRAEPRTDSCPKSRWRARRRCAISATRR